MVIFPHHLPTLTDFLTSLSEQREYFNILENFDNPYFGLTNSQITSLWKNWQEKKQEGAKAGLSVGNEAELIH